MCSCVCVVVPLFLVERSVVYASMMMYACVLGNE